MPTKEVWLVGKGPSIQGYDWQDTEHPRVCINETVFVVPSPDAAIAIDYDVLDKYKEAKLKVLVYKKNTHQQYTFANEYVYFFKDITISRHATAPIAIELLYNLGARIIHFVGFDSMDGETDYAASIVAMKAQGKNKDGYKRINIEIMKVIDQLGVTPIWEHKKVH